MASAQTGEETYNSFEGTRNDTYSFVEKCKFLRLGRVFSGERFSNKFFFTKGYKMAMTYVSSKPHVVEALKVN